MDEPQDDTEYTPLGLFVRRGVDARARIGAALGTPEPRAGEETPFYVTDAENLAILAERLRVLEWELGQLRDDSAALKGTK